jgi:hypothetical protein
LLSNKPEGIDVMEVETNKPLNIVTKVLLSNKPEGIDAKDVQLLKQSENVVTEVVLSNKPEGNNVSELQPLNVLAKLVNPDIPVIGLKIAVSLLGLVTNLNTEHSPLILKV